MPEVRLKIGPKTYTLACGEGEEEKIERLGAMIVERYDQLGSARAPLETHNLVFAALFMADEMTDLKTRLESAEKEAESQSGLTEELEQKHADALAKATAEADNARERASHQKDEMTRELETVRKSEERAREEAAALKEEIAELREAQRHQHDLFGSEIDEEALVQLLETLAERAESAADTLESAKLEDAADTA